MALGLETKYTKNIRRSTDSSLILDSTSHLRMRNPD